MRSIIDFDKVLTKRLNMLVEVATSLFGVLLLIKSTNYNACLCLLYCCTTIRLLEVTDAGLFIATNERVLLTVEPNTTEVLRLAAVLHHVIKHFQLVDCHVIQVAILVTHFLWSWFQVKRCTARVKFETFRGHSQNSSILHLICLEELVNVWLPGL